MNSRCSLRMSRFFSHGFSGLGSSSSQVWWCSWASSVISCQAEPGAQWETRHGAPELGKPGNIMGNLWEIYVYVSFLVEMVDIGGYIYIVLTLGFLECLIVGFVLLVSSPPGFAIPLGKFGRWLCGSRFILTHIHNRLVVWNMNSMTFHIWGMIIPTDELIFFRGVLVG